MIQRILNSTGLLTYLAAAATWLVLYFGAPFPEENLFLRLIAQRAPVVFQGLKCSYLLFLFTTPYIVYSILLSGTYVFALRVRRRISPGRLPPYPDPRKRNELFLLHVPLCRAAVRPTKPTTEGRIVGLILEVKGRSAQPLLRTVTAQKARQSPATQSMLLRAQPKAGHDESRRSI